MALIGQGAVPIGIDYSGYADAAWRSASATSGAVAQIGAKLEGLIEEKKKQKDTVKVSADKIDAAIRLFGDQGGYLVGIGEKLKDEEIPLSQRAALGGQIDEMLSLGIDKMRNDALMGLQREQLAMEGRRVALQEREYVDRGLAAGQAAQTDDEMALSDAITRMTALREAELQAGDKIPQMAQTNDLIDALISQGRGKEALKAVENYAKVREPQLEQFTKPQTVKPLKIGGTGPAGEPVEIDAFVTPTGELYDVQGQPLNAPQGPAAVGGLPATPDVATDGVLPPRTDVPPPRIQPTPTIGIRPVNRPPSMKDTPEEAQTKRRMEMGDKRLADIQSGASVLAGNIGTLRETKALLDKVETGFGKQALTDAKRVFGMDVTNEEQLQTLLGDQVMARVAQTKGAVSEKEMDLFQQYSANFGKTTEGNKRIIAFALKAAERAKKISAVIDDGMDKGKSPFEIQREVSAIQESDPLESTLGNSIPSTKDETSRLRGMLGQ